MIAAGLHDVPAGHIPAVVTYLQMKAPAMAASKPFPKGIVATREEMRIDDYRALFRAIGVLWLWSGRLTLDDQALSDTLADPQVEVWVVRRHGTAIGLVELDFRQGESCELLYFGLVAAATGQGLGGPMMALAQERAFAKPQITRLYLHTCNWDDPRALSFYRRAGLTPYQRMVEIYPDPRLNGVLPRDAAPHIPCLEIGDET